MNAPCWRRVGKKEQIEELNVRLDEAEKHLQRAFELFSFPANRVKYFTSSLRQKS